MFFVKPSPQGPQLSTSLAAYCMFAPDTTARNPFNCARIRLIGPIRPIGPIPPLRFREALTPKPQRGAKNVARGKASPTSAAPGKRAHTHLPSPEERGRGVRLTNSKPATEARCVG